MDHPSPAELLKIASTIAVAAREIAAQGRENLVVTNTKSSDTDVVTQMDIAVEKYLRAELAKHRPEDGILGEEGADTVAKSGITWVLDPIDGTVNYLYGLPFYAVSVAAVSGDVRTGTWEVLAGAVAAGTGELWTASRGGGAQLNGVNFSRPEPRELGHILLGTGFQYEAHLREQQGQVLAQVLGQVRDVRRLGSAAMDLCLVADGRLDAYYEHGLNAWDYAAGMLVAQEAGIEVLGLAAAPADSRFLLAAAPERWHELYRVLSAAGVADI